MKKLFLFEFIILLLFTNQSIDAQSFDRNVLVNLSGHNYDYELLPMDFVNTDNFIVWINENDSKYTLYLKSISPAIEDNIIIKADSIKKTNPKIIYDWNYRKYRITWQEFDKDNYRIITRLYSEDSIYSDKILCDSLETNPQMDISTYRLIWIENENLYERSFSPELGDIKLIDSLGCSTPDISSFDSENYCKLVYTKETNDSSFIYLTEYNGAISPNWKQYVISKGICRNPNFGIEGDLSFEKYENSVWQICYSDGPGDFNIISNKYSNTQNPFVFTYPQVTGPQNISTPFFVAFDSDSIENNKEIFIKTFYYGIIDSLINISNMEGNDVKPKVTYQTLNDTIFVAVIWQHLNESQSDIWISKALFCPILTSVNNQDIVNANYSLSQNYPNPFNPATTIKYSIPESPLLRGVSKGRGVSVALKVFNLLGQEVATLVNKEQSAGNYEVKFDASNLASGVYLYQLKAGSFTQTKKMVYLR